MKNKGAKETAKNRITTGETIWKNIKDSKQVSAGILSCNGVFALDNPNFFMALKDCQDKQKAEKYERVCKKRKIIVSHAKKVKAARAIRT